jgi:tRNA (cmo5U34)-methyltransferase|tara:strand:- start:190 stop:840 length:651 start_codon:yes stop_codon:yes gene_type:complete
MEDKRFNFNDITDFEKHIELSIPNFLTLDNIFRNITHEYAQPESTVVDLGCSTGRFLTSLNQIPTCEYMGIDTVDMEQRRDGFLFIQGDCEAVLPEIHQTSVIVSMFFLQFLGKHQRRRVLNIIKPMLDAGGILLIAEKVFLNDSRLQQIIHKLHIQEKRKGFTDTEILDKDLKLSVSMYCKTEQELMNELNEIGVVSKVWQSFNFMGFMVAGKQT